jgi:recombination protein RecA
MSASPVFSSAAPGRPFIFSPRPTPHVPSYAEKTAEKLAEILAHVGTIPKLSAVVPASRLDVRPTTEMVSSGIAQLDSLTGGLARGCLTEICGSASSGRTSVLLLALARATQRGEVCALVDTSDGFDPASAAAAGMEMSRLLWVRCGEKYPSRKHPSAALTGCGKTNGSYQGMPSGIAQGLREEHDFSRAVSPAQSPAALAAEGSHGPFSRYASTSVLQTAFFPTPFRAGSRTGEFSGWKNPEAERWETQIGQMLKVADLLLQSNGFGMVAIDLGDVPVQSARRIPLASWFRFRRAVEHTPTVLLVLEQQPIAGSCSSVLLRVSAVRSQVPGKRLSAVSSPLLGNRPVDSALSHSELLDQFEITAELLRSRLDRKLERKPVQSSAFFKSRAAWAG